MKEVRYYWKGDSVCVSIDGVEIDTLLSADVDLMPCSYTTQPVMTLKFKCPKLIFGDGKEGDK
jgi:hypothetical protein